MYNRFPLFIYEPLRGGSPFPPFKIGFGKEQTGNYLFDTVLVQLQLESPCIANDSVVAIEG